MDNSPMFEEELFSRIYDMAFQEMEKNFREPGVYMELLSTLGKEKQTGFWICGKEFESKKLSFFMIKSFNLKLTYDVLLPYETSGTLILFIFNYYSS